MESIHRIIEHQAVVRGDEHAVIDNARALSYRVLNGRANTVARHLMASGLRRGGHAVVTGTCGQELAVALLAVLKAGASYTWVSAEPGSRNTVSIRSGPDGAQEESLVMELPGDDPESHTSPNLPVMTRGSDVACVLQPFTASATMIPHATIAALARLEGRTPEDPRPPMTPSATTWTGDDGALGLWLALMAGHTLTVAGPYPAAA